MSTPTIIEFVTDPELLGLSLSPAQEVLLRGVYGLPLPSDHHLELWRQCTGRETYPGCAFGETTVVAGARSGKDSRIAAPIVVYEALFGGHEAYLAKGERGIIPLVAQDQRATKIAFGYIRQAFMGAPLLSSMVEGMPLVSEIPLKNGLTISCFPSTLRSLRGWSMPVGVMDELAFYRLEGQADADVEIQSSIRRGMLSFPSPKLLKISTPYMKSGVLFDDFRRAWSQDNPDLLVWRAPTALMNPSITTERLDRERRLDPERFAREYEATFAEGLDAFLPSNAIESIVTTDRRELPPLTGVRYFAAADPSGGAADAFTLAIVHLEGDRVVHDVMRGWGRSGGGTPSLGGVVAEIATLCESYGARDVLGDRYGGQWVVQAFRDRGIRYHASAWTKTDAYLIMAPLALQGRLELLEHGLLLRELSLLERKYHPGGRVSVDHPPGYHDDHANALALAVLLAWRSRTAAQDWEESRPEGTAFPRRGGEDLERLKLQALERGISRDWLDAMEREVGREHFADYLREMLEENTLAGRFRRAGLPR